MSDRRLTVRIMDVKPLHAGFLRVNHYRVEVERHAGGTRELDWEVMERGNAVGVLGYDPIRDEVVLVNEFRPGAMAAGDYPFTDNVVAGGIVDGESAVEAARREMKEEAGLDLLDARTIHPGAYVSSGGTSEKIVIVLGIVDSSNAGGIHGNPEEREDIRVAVLPAAEFIECVRRGDITDLKTLVAGYWLADHRESLRKSR
jgi:ADP-ribose pyrophosphatase